MAKNLKDCYKLLQLSGVKVVDKDKVAVILEPSATQPRGKHHAQTPIHLQTSIQALKGSGYHHRHLMSCSLRPLGCLAGFGSLIS